MSVFFNDTATTEIYTLSLHDALPIWRRPRRLNSSKKKWTISAKENTGPRTPDRPSPSDSQRQDRQGSLSRDRKSTRLNSSHANISYAVFCLKKKKKYN